MQPMLSPEPLVPAPQFHEAISPVMMDALPVSVATAVPVYDHNRHVVDMRFTATNSSARHEWGPGLSHPSCGTVGSILRGPAGEACVRALLTAFRRHEHCFIVDTGPVLIPWLATPRRFEINARRVGNTLLLTWHDISEIREYAGTEPARTGSDPLTMLPDRSVMMARLDARVRHIARHGERIGVLMCDIDDFRAVNEAHGHAVGDGVLQTVARRLQACIRGDDMAARLEADRFLVLLDGVRARLDVVRIAKMMLREVAKPIRINGTEIHVALSIGAIIAARGERSDSLLERAERAMRTAKLSGSSRVSALSA